MGETNKEEKQLAREGYKALTSIRGSIRETTTSTTKKAAIKTAKLKLSRREINKPVRLHVTGKSESILLSGEAVNALTKVLGHLARGNEVSVTARPRELTTQKAADFLNVSRPFLVGLLEKGEIPFHKVGTHRRIRFEDLEAYKDKIDAERLKNLKALTKQAQELDLGY